MDESFDTRPELLVRLCDLKDERAWTEFVGDGPPLIYQIARAGRGFSTPTPRISSRRSCARSLPPWTAGNPTHVKGLFATGCSGSRGT